MDHYIDIKVLPDPEFSQAVLLNALYAKLHRVIINAAQGRIGVSFPEYGKTLGSVLRLHGSQQDLDALQNYHWLKGMNDYTASTRLEPVPSQVKHRTVQRVQTKSALNKLKRSLAKGWISEEQFNLRLNSESETKLKEPYAVIRSLSNGAQAMIYIRLGEIQAQATAGTFSSYGLSKTATIPWF